MNRTGQERTGRDHNPPAAGFIGSRYRFLESFGAVCLSIADRTVVSDFEIPVWELGRADSAQNLRNLLPSGTCLPDRSDQQTKTEQYRKVPV
jgi:hypothetical protein